MKRWGLVTALTAVLLMSAQPAQAQAPDLGSVLITLDDFPSGWSQEAVPPPQNDGIGLCGIPNPPRRERQEAEARFQRTSIGPIVDHYVRTVAMDADAIDGVFLRDLPLPCEWDQPDPDTGGINHWSARRMSFIKLGEDLGAVRISVAGRGFVVEVANVIERRGEIVSILSYVDIGSTFADVDTRELERLARLADQRLAAVLAAVPSPSSTLRPLPPWVNPAVVQP